MECVARAVSVSVVPPRVAGARKSTGARQPTDLRRGGVGGPLRATRRGWGETDSRFSRLDKRRDADDYAGDAYDDSEKNISFQELRKRQDREQQRKV